MTRAGRGVLAERQRLRQRAAGQEGAGQAAAHGKRVKGRSRAAGQRGAQEWDRQAGELGWGKCSALEGLWGGPGI